MLVDSDVIIVESSSEERCGTHAPLPVTSRGMKDCPGGGEGSFDMSFRFFIETKV